MYPLKFFVPDQTTYTMANRYLKGCERNLHTLKQKEYPEYYVTGESRYDEEIVRDFAKIALTYEQMEVFRMGMHFAAISICSHIMKDIQSLAAGYFKSLNYINDAKCRMSDYDLDEDTPPIKFETESELLEDIRVKIESLRTDLEKAESCINKNFPFHGLVEIAMLDEKK